MGSSAARDGRGHVDILSAALITPTPFFVPFGPDHIAVLLGMGLALASLVWRRRQLVGRDDTRLRREVAIFLLVNEALSWIVGLAQGSGRVPLQLCDLALLLTVGSLLRPTRAVSELAYFWGLAGSVQAILTPDLVVPFPGYWWLKFFTTHCGIVLGVVYLALTGRTRPTQRSVWIVWGWTNVYAMVVGCLNGIYGTNYGYLAHKPMHPSLLDYFGPWPYYIGVSDLMALALFEWCYLLCAWTRVAPRSHRRQPA